MKWMTIAALCALALAGLTALVTAGPLMPVEIEVIRWAVGLRNEALTGFIQLLTFISSAAPALLITLGLSALELRRELRREWQRGEISRSLPERVYAVMRSYAYWPTLAYAGALACNIAMRIAVGRMPPEVDYIPHLLPEFRAEFQGFSFPSGHAGAAVVAYISLAIIASRWTRARRWAWIAATIIIVGVGFGRVYLGVHWPTDVLAGFLLAGVWLAVSIGLRNHAAQRAAPLKLKQT